MNRLRFAYFAIVAGLVLLFVGMAYLAISNFQRGSISVGGVIFIGPFPIVFGAGPSYQYLLLVSLVIAAMMITLSFLLLRWQRTEQKHEVEGG